MTDNKEDRECSLKKLHFCILNYQTTTEEKKMLVHAKQELRDKIEFKYKKSEINKEYKFPLKYKYEEEYDEQPQLVNLYTQDESNSETQKVLDDKTNELKNRPKIKIVKQRNDRRQQTQYLDKKQISNIKQNLKVKLRNQQQIKQSPQQLTNNYAIESKNKQRFKTQYITNEQQSSNPYPYELKNSNSSQKIAENRYFLNNLSKNNANSQSKSKLNLLTKSYMNLKASKNNMQLFASKQLNESKGFDMNRTNSFKGNEFKQSYSKISKNITSKAYQSSNLANPTWRTNNRSSDKISSLLNDKKYRLY